MRASACAVVCPAPHIRSDHRPVYQLPQTRTCLVCGKLHVFRCCCRLVVIMIDVLAVASANSACMLEKNVRRARGSDFIFPLFDVVPP
mmetsp:Transcript_22883/g.61400  ORF Transcript_22883/g.61400 Transcript_22883/m.61400 type:complete len:88 (-) Transcript_22883:6-269(-)|eukprot:652861-Prymnesium_polylepis.1